MALRTCRQMKLLAKKNQQQEIRLYKDTRGKTAGHCGFHKMSFFIATKKNFGTSQQFSFTQCFVLVKNYSNTKWYCDIKKLAGQQ